MDNKHNKYGWFFRILVSATTLICTNQIFAEETSNATTITTTTSVAKPNVSQNTATTNVTTKTDATTTDTNVGDANTTTTTETSTTANDDATATTDTTTTTESDSTTTDSDENTEPTVPQADPYEKFNRAMFSFNDKLDTYFLKPIATLYNKIMPKPLNKGIHNAYLNIGELPTIANDILQFNFFQMANDLWRLGINTTVGIGGLFDVATPMGLPYYSNDFGLTLARWGYKNSNYLVLPFFGPNTPRDGIGIPIDYFAFSIYPYINPESLRYEIYGLGVIDRRANLLQYQSVLEEASLDKYVFYRSAYMQHRAQQIEDNAHRTYADRAKNINKPAADESDTVTPDQPDVLATGNAEADTVETNDTNSEATTDTTLNTGKTNSENKKLDSISLNQAVKTIKNGLLEKQKEAKQI